MCFWQFRITSLLVIALLAGCATPVSNNIKVSAENIAKYSDLSDLAVVTALEKNINDAKSAKMPFLAPHYFEEAAKILSECQNALGKTPKETLVNNAAKGDAILEKGRTVMAIVQYRFAKELEYKAQLEEHNAPKLLPKETEAVMARLSRLIEKVEREQAENIDRDKESLQKDMLDLVIKAVQEGVLRESEAINTESKKKGAKRQAPVTYTAALKVYQEAKSQIAASHHDRPLVQRLGSEALFAAHHAQQVNERVAQLQTQLKFSSAGSTQMSVAAGGMTGAQMGVQVGIQMEAQTEGRPFADDRLTLEKLVLQEEDRLLSISSALGIKDLRDKPIDKQVEEIKLAIGARPSCRAALYDVDAKLKVGNGGFKHVQDELAEREAQLIENDHQLAAQPVKKLKPAASTKETTPKK